jgi:hypothetical protein
MPLAISIHAGRCFVEGPPGATLLRTAGDVSIVIETCLGSRAERVLLHAENLPAAFFDLSSGEAGAMLQKLRNYGVRLAVVCPAGAVRFSRRFGEMVREESRGEWFRLFDDRESAQAWLCADAPP